MLLEAGENCHTSLKPQRTLPEGTSSAGPAVKWPPCNSKRPSGRGNSDAYARMSGHWLPTTCHALGSVTDSLHTGQRVTESSMDLKVYAPNRRSRARATVGMSAQQRARSERAGKIDKAVIVKFQSVSSLKQVVPRG